MSYLSEVKTTIHFSYFYFAILFYRTKNIRLNSPHYFFLKIPNNQEFQQIAFYHSSDIDLKGFMMNLYKKCTAVPYSFLVIGTTLASDNYLRFRKNMFMTADYKVRHEKLQPDINKETAKIYALSTDKIDKCEYLTGKEVLPTDQRRVMKQAKFTYGRCT